MVEWNRNFPVIPIFRNFRPTSRGTPKISGWNLGKCLFHSLPHPEFLFEWKATLDDIAGYYSTNCNTIQIWSWCSRYLSSVGNVYPAIYVASYVGRKSEVKKLSTERFCRQFFHFTFSSHVRSYVYRRIYVTYGWQISRASWPYLDSVTIC